MSSLGRRTGLIGAATGVLALGAGVGLAVERYLVGRRRTPDPQLDIPLGSLRGEPAVVTTDDGIELYAEIDHASGDSRDSARASGTAKRRGRRGPAETAGSAPLTVVFVHGYALNMDCYHFQRQALSGSVRMVFYDQRSHGRSGRAPKESCTVDRLGDDLGQVIDQLAPEGPLLLVGHSMGGMTVLALARKRPELFAERVVGVALLATSAGDMGEVTLGVPGPVGRLVHRLVPSFVAALSRAPDLVEHGRKAGSDIGYLLTKRYSFASKVPPARVEFLAEMLAATPIEVVADFFPGFSTHDEYDALRRLEDIETLIMCGEDDIIVPIGHSRELARRLPRAHYTELPDCGHMLILEYPEVVNERLRQLLGRAAEAAAWEESG